MKIAAILASAALLISACGGDQPVPERGLITDASHTPAWVQFIPGATTCSGNPPRCSTMPPTMVPWPESWRLEVTALNNPEWKGTVAVDQSVYEQCNLRELWPECSQESVGDARLKS